MDLAAAPHQLIGELHVSAVPSFPCLVSATETAMNRTREFQQLVEKVQSSLSDVAGDVRVKTGASSMLLKKRVNKGDWNAFTDGIRKLVRNISNMQTLLLRNRKDYVNLYSPLVSEASSMTDEDRDRIDYEMHEFTKKCSELLNSFRKQLSLKTDTRNLQAKDHFTKVLDLVEVYLKVVCGIYSQQHAIRVKRACERQRLSRLAASFSSSRSDRERHASSSVSSAANQRPADRRVVTLDEDHGSQLASSELSVEEVQLFEKENVQIYDELNSLNDEVKIIGGKVMEIAKLQEIFTENVLKQEDEIGRLNSTVIASTESVREGNDQLREAIKKGAGFRVWVLFSIITLAFTVLFLDWYNP